MQEDSMKEFAKDYWELGAMALLTGLVAIDPAYQPLFTMTGFGVAYQCAKMFRHPKEQHSVNLEKNFRTVRDITFYVSAGVILDRNQEYMTQFSEIGKIAIPSFLLLSSCFFDKLRSEKKEENIRFRKTIEDGLK